jgi:hypothetical protein
VRRVVLLRAPIVLSFWLVVGCASVHDWSDENVTRFLVEDFETVVYTQGSLFSARGEASRLSSDERDTLLRPFGLLLAVFNQPELSRLSSLLTNEGMQAVFLGAKSFRRSDGLFPESISERSYVIKLADKNFDLAAVLRAKTSDELQGRPVWKTRRTWGEPNRVTAEVNEAQLFILQPFPGYLVVSTSSDLAQRTLSAIEKERDSAIGLPGWRDLADSPYWAYRNFKMHTSLENDISGAALVSSQASSITLETKPGFAEPTLRYFSAVPKDPTPDRLNESEAHFGFKQAGSGQWVAALTLSDKDSGFMQRYLLLALFGFGLSA